MTLLLESLKKLLGHTNRWRGVELAGWTALAMTACSVAVFTFATKTSRLGSDFPTPSLLYPYLAVASVFVTTCIWILSGARIGISSDLITDHRLRAAKRWFWRTVAIVSLILLVSGWAGDQGIRAAKSLNWYLFGPLDDPVQGGSWRRKNGMPYTLLAVIGNALALATLVYLGALCKGLILSACGTKKDAKSNPPENATIAAFRVGEAERRLKFFLVMASALMVTSTLTLYLSFATADQIQGLQDAYAKRLQHSDQTAKATHLLTIDCRNSTAASSITNCTFSIPTAEKAAKPASSAAYMALVAGLSFTGVLFILFTACSAALSDRASELAKEQLERSTAAARFNLKEWRECTGLADSGAGTHAIQGLALVAPALTGLLTLVNS